MIAPRTLDVDENGEPLNGEQLMIATRKAIRAGFMINAPIILRFPDGRLVESLEGRITPKGLKQAAMEMGKDETKH